MAGHKSHKGMRFERIIHVLQLCKKALKAYLT